MSTTPSLDLLERALDQTGTVIARIRPDQVGSPTPCTEFDVRALVNHIVFDVQVFTAALSGAAAALTIWSTLAIVGSSVRALDVARGWAPRRL